MMRAIGCDTSFLFSLYARDVHSHKAERAVKKLAQALTLSIFNEFEFQNALRLSVFRKLLSPADAGAILADFTADVDAGAYVVANCNLTEVLTEAKRLSATYAQRGGHRAFDILHVAAAVHFAADEFWSFDDNQCSLAQAAGLRPGLW
jgi:predicted nucleic acid-binding protein